jgi:glucose/arabinose dehydrogenase
LCDSLFEQTCSVKESPKCPFRDGFPLGEPYPFLSGFVPDPDGKKVCGRTVGVAIARDGSLLVSDDAQKLIWRVSYGTKSSASR